MRINPREVFMSQASGWMRFLADAFVGIGHSPIRLLWMSCLGALGLLFADYFNAICSLNKWIGVPLSMALVFLFAWALLLGRLLLFFPFPPCCRGQCGSIDEYTWNMGRIFGYERWRIYHYWCKCGDEYIREGRRFYQVLPDGTRKPYLKLIGFRKWQADPEYDR